MITYENSYNGFSINNGSRKGLTLGLETRLLDKLHHLLFDMVSKHNKVFVMMFTLNFPSSGNFYGDNLLISRFTDSIRNHFDSIRDSQGRKLDSRGIWVREKSNSPSVVNQHYHFLILFDGNIIQSAFPKKEEYQVFTKIQELWYKRCQSYHEQLVTLHQPDDAPYNRGGVMIKRSKGQTLNEIPLVDEVHYWISYLAKTNTKDNYPGGKGVGGFNLYR